MQHDPEERRQENVWRRLTDEQAAVDAVLAALTEGRFLHRYEASDPEKRVARTFIERLDSAGSFLDAKGLNMTKQLDEALAAVAGMDEPEGITLRHCPFCSIWQLDEHWFSHILAEHPEKKVRLIGPEGHA